jgi:hypothetical protein
MMSAMRQAGACLGVGDDFLVEPVQRFRAAERQRVERRQAELQAELTRLVPRQGSE